MDSALSNKCLLISETIRLYQVWHFSGIFHSLLTILLHFRFRLFLLSDRLHLDSIGLIFPHIRRPRCHLSSGSHMRIHRDDLIRSGTSTEVEEFARGRIQGWCREQSGDRYMKKGFWNFFGTLKVAMAKAVNISLRRWNLLWTTQCTNSMTSYQLHYMNTIGLRRSWW